MCIERSWHTEKVLMRRKKAVISRNQTVYLRVVTLQKVYKPRKNSACCIRTLVPEFNSQQLMAVLAYTCAFRALVSMNSGT